MIAYQIKKYGKHEPLFANEIEKPLLKDDGILVKVAAASINPVDYRIRTGDAKLILRYKMPLTLGHDFSGVVESVGSAITHFKVGDKVYGRTPLTGSFQEYVLVGENDIARIPRNLGLTDAAAVPLVGLTAYQGLFDWINLKEGQSILILGGSGGVGHVAIQLALLAKAKVYTTASLEGIEFLKPYGEVHFINYNSEKFYHVLQEVDAVFDMRGKADLLNSFDIVKKGGSIASITAVPTPSYAKKASLGKLPQFVLSLITRKYRKMAERKKVSYNAFLTQSNRVELEKLSDLIEKGRLEVKVQKVYPANEVNESIESLMKGRVKGKIVIEFNSNL